MFVYTVKASALKLVGCLCLVAVLTLSLYFLIPGDNTGAVPETSDASEIVEDPKVSEASTKEKTVKYSKIRTNEDRIAFLSAFGWQVESEPIEEVVLKIPKDFDKILSAYNSIQLHQGLDLSKYSGKEVTRVTYRVTNYPNYDGEVVADLIIHRDRVIGGDICSADVDGFIKDFTFPDTSESEGASGEGAFSDEGSVSEATAETAESTE